MLNSPVSLKGHQTYSPQPKIQVAILLDVSGSMSGLIDQAKNQLWNMVNVLSKVTCEGKMPSIEIALYEYGRTTKDIKEVFIKQISQLTQYPEKLFAELIVLKTGGSEEYCGQIMVRSLDELSWDTVGNSYKVIFIAGNESFLQGQVSFTKACEKAKRKGVIINTIYCGDRTRGISEHWDLGAECGNGSYSNIDHNAKPLSTPTPYDDSILRLKDKLNEMYIVYGEEGSKYHHRAMQADTVVVSNLNDPSKILEYVVVRSNKLLYSMPTWNLLDTAEKDPSIIYRIDMTILDDSLKNKTREELRGIVNIKISARNSLRESINTLALKQGQYIRDEKEKMMLNEPQTLESEIEKIIREQVKRFNMKID